MGGLGVARLAEQRAAVVRVDGAADAAPSGARRGTRTTTSRPRHSRVARSTSSVRRKAHDLVDAAEAALRGRNNVLFRDAAAPVAHRPALRQGQDLVLDRGARDDHARDAEGVVPRRTRPARRRRAGRRRSPGRLGDVAAGCASVAAQGWPTRPRRRTPFRRRRPPRQRYGALGLLLGGETARGLLLRCGGGGSTARFCLGRSYAPRGLASFLLCGCELSVGRRLRRARCIFFRGAAAAASMARSFPSSFARGSPRRRQCRSSTRICAAPLSHRPRWPSFAALAAQAAE